MKDLTKEELNWTRRIQRAFNCKPHSLLLYVTDYEIVICKRGVSSEDISNTIAGSTIGCGCVLTDMHDDMGNGDNNEEEV